MTEENNTVVQEKKEKKTAGRRGIRLWAVVVWLIVWEVAARLIHQEIFLVSPVKVIVRLSEMVREARFWQSVLNSSVRITLGFFLGLLCGIAMAALSSRYRRLKELFAPFILVIKTVPVASFIILALIFFSSRNLAVLISFMMTLPVIYTNLMEGAAASDVKLTEMAKVFRMPKLRVFRYITLPQVYPYLVSACSVACGLAWKSGIAAEVIGIPARSIGERLQQAKVYLNTKDLLAWTLVIVIVSLAFEKILHLILVLIRKLLIA
ncbi:MAG: ABC transporter permease subunit [Lachnospiraceae bacterium]|nr:ABC transporter permease subunit [Lachnospiraceae bacterium]